MQVLILGLHRPDSFPLCCSWNPAVTLRRSPASLLADEGPQEEASRELLESSLSQPAAAFFRAEKDGPGKDGPEQNCPSEPTPHYPQNHELHWSGGGGGRRGQRMDDYLKPLCLGGVVTQQKLAETGRRPEMSGEPGKSTHAWNTLPQVRSRYRGPTG